MTATPWLETTDPPVTQDYGPTDLALEPAAHGYQHFHEGIDLGVGAGTLVDAPVAGTVLERQDPGGFGNYIDFQPDAQPGVDVILGHLQDFLVGPGHVDAGAQLAETGSTGNSTGPHLHFQENVNGQDVNPSGALYAPASTFGVGGPLPDGGNQRVQVGAHQGQSAGGLPGLPSVNVNFNPFTDLGKQLEQPFQDAKSWVYVKAWPAIAGNMFALLLAAIIIVVVLGVGNSDEGGGSKTEVIPVPV